MEINRPPYLYTYSLLTSLGWSHVRNYDSYEDAEEAIGELVWDLSEYTIGEAYSPDSDVCTQIKEDGNVGLYTRRGKTVKRAPSPTPFVPTSMPNLDPEAVDETMVEIGAT